MNNLLEIMDKESCSKSEVYLYEEEGPGMLTIVPPNP